MTWWLLAAAPAVAMAFSWLRWRAKELDARKLAAQRALTDGDFDRAAAIFEALVQMRGAQRDLLHLELARLYALRGDVASAARHAEAARQRLQRPHADRAIGEARLLLIDALITTRRGDFAEAYAALAQRWATFETSHGGWRAEACLLRGYLSWKLGSSVEAWLGLGDAARARVRWMASDWPELRAFIDAHDVSEP